MFTKEYEVLPTRVELYKYIAAQIPTFDLNLSLKAPMLNFYMDNTWHRVRTFRDFVNIINPKLTKKLDLNLTLFRGRFILVFASQTPTTLEVIPEDMNIVAGLNTTVNYYVIATPSGTSTDVIWSSNYPDVDIINSDGSVVGTNVTIAGTYTISATSVLDESVVGTSTLVVSPADPEGDSLEPVVQQVQKKASKSLKAKIVEVPLEDTLTSTETTTINSVTE